MEIKILYFIYAFILGAVLASFASALAWRTGKIKHKEKFSIFTGRSVCPNCKKQLSWWSLFPIFSYIFLQGKCFSCKKHISIFYPIMEIFSAVFSIFLLNRYLDGEMDLFILILFFFTTFVLIVLSFQDIWFEEISDKIAIPAIIIVLFSIILNYFFTNRLDVFIQNFFIASVIVSFFMLLVIFTDSMGGGDLRAFAIISLTLVFPDVLYALTVGFVLASIFGIGFAFTQSKKNILKVHIRLIPFLSIGFAIVLIWGNILQFTI